jgi:hypothetical protein
MTEQTKTPAQKEWAKPQLLRLGQIHSVNGTVTGMVQNRNSMS